MPRPPTTLSVPVGRFSDDPLSHKNTQRYSYFSSISHSRAHTQRGGVIRGVDTTQPGGGR